jgi:hypothetical protein
MTKKRLFHKVLLLASLLVLEQWQWQAEEVILLRGQWQWRVFVHHRCLRMDIVNQQLLLKRIGIFSPCNE